MLELQLPPVLASLPHARAETSNAVWNLKEGALYGFFSAVVSRIFSFAVFLVSKVHLPVLLLGTPPSRMRPCAFFQSRRGIIKPADNISGRRSQAPTLCGRGAFEVNSSKDWARQVRETVLGNP